MIPDKVPYTRGERNAHTLRGGVPAFDAVFRVNTDFYRRWSSPRLNA